MALFSRYDTLRRNAQTGRSATLGTILNVGIERHLSVPTQSFADVGTHAEHGDKAKAQVQD